jgi:uncharacterized membrane protein YcaP (DUF421 family)
VFFNSWPDLGRVAVVSAVLFIIVVAVLRIVGQQALAKMSGYDLVVTVSIGSIVASVALTRTMTVADAVTALITLMLLQEVTRWVQARWLLAHHAVREEPLVVVWDGEFLDDRMRANSISADEIRAAVRRDGLASIDEVLIVVLENDGDWSVIPKRRAQSDNSALHGLDIPGQPSRGDGARNSGSDGSPRLIP